MAQETYSAFFSYSREDSEFVLKLARDLRFAGAVVWLDQLDIKPGQHWDSAVEKALADCRTMLLVLSPSSVASSNVMDEVSFALDEQKLIIPVLHRTCTIPFRLRRVQYIDARTEYGAALKELLQLLAPGETGQAKRERAAAEREAAEKAVPMRTVAAEPRPKPQSRAKYWIAAIVAMALALSWGIWHSASPPPPDVANPGSPGPLHQTPTNRNPVPPTKQTPSHK